MSECISQKNWSYESWLDNVNEQLSWVKKQVEKELSGLKKDIQVGQIKNSFFEKKWNKVEYHVDLVKQYLQSCIAKETFHINTAMIMAVQILLETKWYDLGQIDWLLKTSSWKESKTEKTIKKFQADNWLVVDWIPWKKTIKKLLDLSPSIDIKEDDKIKTSFYTKNELFALELYRWKYFTNEQIENKWYNPKEILALLNDKEKMDKMDKLLPKFDKWQEKSSSQYLSGVESHDENPWNSTENVENKENTDNIDKNENNTNTNTVLPIYNEWNNFYINNRQEYIDNTDILIWPKLEASIPDQVWGIWSSMMKWFSWITFKNMEGITSATTRNNNRFWKEWKKWELDEEKMKNYCEDKELKSFMFYFWWNEAVNSQSAVDQAYDDILVMWEYLEKIWVQPVLCTCIWEFKKEHSIWKNCKEYPLAWFNSKIRDLWKSKNWPVIDFAKIDKGNVWYSSPEATHPSPVGWYCDMRNKILENLSSN